MAVSQNGWVAQTSSSGLASLEWITGRVLPGDVHTIFDYFCRRFHQSVEPIRRDHSWGWAYRDVRGASVLSNHASATAIDLNAPAHPLGRSGTFSPGQMRALRPLLASLDGAVRWGGDYPGRPDEMHFEINAPRALVAAVAAKIRGAATGGSGVGITPAPTTNPRPVPPTPQEDPDMGIMLRNNVTGEVLYVQGGKAVPVIGEDYGRWQAAGVKVVSLSTAGFDLARDTYR